MTVQVTFAYTMDASSCLVDTCCIIWGAVHCLYLQGELAWLAGKLLGRYRWQRGLSSGLWVAGRRAGTHRVLRDPHFAACRADTRAGRRQ